MLLVKMYLLVVFMFLLTACSADQQPTQVSQIPVAPPTILANPAQISETATASPTAKASPTQTSTVTPLPLPTEPPMTATIAAMVDSYSATMVAMAGSEGALLNIGQYFNPVGVPLQTWHNVPIMSQATAGQEYSADIYSYIATATLAQARQFIQSNALSLGLVNPPGTGSSGSGNRASHNIDFISYNLTIVLTSFDNDSSHVIVVISKIQ
jgi:hypothetical protein